MSTMDRFYLSDNMSENAAYQLISSRILRVLKVFTSGKGVVGILLRDRD